MSTTIYLHRIPSQFEIELIKKRAEENKIFGKSSVESIMDSIKKEKDIEVALSSCGWKLKFYENSNIGGISTKEKLYQYLREKLNSGCWELIGYGVMSLEDLINLEKEKSNGYTDRTYPKSNGIYDVIAEDGSCWIPSLIEL